MPPQQFHGLLDLFGDGVDFGAHEGILAPIPAGRPVPGL
jgi:hypothetical protein